MTIQTPRTPVHLPPPETPGPPEPPYPWRRGLIAVAFALVLVGGMWIAMEVSKGPATAGQFPTAPTATAYAQQLAATAAAIETAHPRSTPQPATGATAAPTPARAAVPTTEPAPTRAPTAAASDATVSVVAPTMAPGTAPAPQSTVAPALAEEVGQAYLRYWDISGQALLDLDASLLDTVAAGPALTGLRNDIEQNRAAGRAVQTDVEHHYIVIRIQGDEAEVADAYRDSSVFVDPVTHESLPGEVHPPTPAEAPETKLLYHLRRVDGTWKVWGAERI